MNKIFSIAEIGINHNGDLKIAKEMISRAKNCGFNSVKFQKRTIDLVYSKEILSQFRESPWGKTNLEQKNGLEFNEDQYKEIDNYCKELKIEWFASAWDIESLKFLENYNKLLSSRDAEKYVDGETDVVDMTKIVNDFALIRNQWLGITKGLDQKQWQITNIVKLRVAGMEDADIK